MPSSSWCSDSSLRDEREQEGQWDLKAGTLGPAGPLTLFLELLAERVDVALGACHALATSVSSLQNERGR